MVTVQIRPARATDAAALAALAAVTFPLACPPWTTADEISDFIAKHLTRDRFAEYLADLDRTLLVAVADDADDPAWRGRLDGTDGLVGWSMLVRTEDGVPADPDAAVVDFRRRQIAFDFDAEGHFAGEHVESPCVDGFRIVL